MAKNNNAKKVAAGAAIAALAGYVAGMLTAPKSGKKLREDIKREAPTGVHDAKERLKFLYDELNELLINAKEESKDLSGKHKEKFEFAQSKATDARERLSKLIDDIKDDQFSDKDLRHAVKDAEKAIGHFKDFLLKK